MSNRCDDPKGACWRPFQMESFENGPGAQIQSNPADFVQIPPEAMPESVFVPFSAADPHQDRRQAAEALVKRAAAKAEQIELEAYEKGFAQGEKDGFELGEKKAAKIAENIAGLLSELERRKKEIIRSQEREILELIYAIAAKVVQHEIERHPETVEQAIMAALGLAVEKERVRIHVNPEDCDLVERVRPQLLAQHNELKSVTIISDAGIRRGGCLVETGYGDVDARIESRLARLEEALSRALAEERNA